MVRSLMGFATHAEKTVMTHVSRPLIGLLVGAVLFFALWIVALKPSGSGSPSGSGGLGQYQSAINAARNSVKLQDHQSATAGNIPGTATTPGTAGTPVATKTSATVTRTPAKPASHRRAATRPHAATAHSSRVVVVHKPVVHATSPREGINVVGAALRAHKVLAILFYNPAGVDDEAVKHELDSIPTYRGRVVKLAVPVSQLSRYTAITTQVTISTTPTLVLVDRNLQASLITGFASRFEIATRVATAIETR